jgi:hypothetical protein
MRSKETGLFISRIINDSLRQHFGMVIKWSDLKSYTSLRRLYYLVHSFFEISV